MKHIQSPTNPLVKSLRRLAQARKREPLFLIEGRKLVLTAIASGVDLETVVVSSSYSDELPRDASLAVLPASLFTELSTVDSPEGILAVARRPGRPSATLPGDGTIVVSAGIQDPGNLGAVARVTEAAGAAALVVLKGSADPFGPKAVRGSAGSVFRLPVFEEADIEALSGIPLAALVPRGGTDFREVQWTPPLGVVLGGEGAGLDEAILESSDLRVSIPMQGHVESLNVATAAALVLFEATRRGA